MKKSILVMVIALMLAVSVIVPVSAASVQPELSVNGSESTVELTVATSSVYGGLQGVITYDAEKLTYKGATVVDGLADSAKVEKAIKETEAGKITVALIGDVGNGTAGEWFTLNFDVKGEEAAVVTFAFNSVKASSVDGRTSTTLDNTSVNWAVNSVIGDVSGDGTVDIRDLVCFKKNSVGIAGTFIEANADCNGDGKLDIADDIVALRRFLLGTITVLGNI